LIEEMDMQWSMTRREFFRAGGLSLLGLKLSTLSCLAEQQPKVQYPYRDWEDLYKKHWSWDRVVKGTHSVANCSGTCGFDLYVKEGIVWREEQIASYPQTNPEVPDFNPRGCQKGICYSELMYSPRRIKYPLKRVGERGEGRWRRISWDEALEEIADKMIDVLERYGPEAIMNVMGVEGSFGFGAALSAQYRFYELLGISSTGTWGELGDLSVGAVITWGYSHVDGTSDDWFNSDMIILWKINPSYTKIPDAHFLWEARYKGAQIVSIAPDYNPSSIHASLWVNPRVGTDIALALSMAQVIVEEKLYDASYIKEQTDLPFLVREDNRKFLRQKDMEEGGRDDVFYVWDSRSHSPREAPGSMGHAVKSIALGDLDAALEGSWEIKGRENIKVRTVFEYLKDRLKHYSPEEASRITGVNADIIRRLARDFAKAKSALIISSWGSNKFYHSDLMQRSRILLAALCGHTGKPGGGFRTLGMYPTEGEFMTTFPKLMTGNKGVKICPGTLWAYIHGGLKGISDRKEYGDVSMKRSPASYIQESIERGWMPVYPGPAKEPKILFQCGANFLRRCRSSHVIRRELWPKLELIVDINFRMDSTALNSDIVLPAAGWYERMGTQLTISYLPYLNFGDKAVDPLFESKDEWDIFSLLAEKISKKAKQRNIAKIFDELDDISRDLTTLYDEFTQGGKLSDREFHIKLQLENTAATKGITLEELRRKGFARYASSGLLVGEIPTGAFPSTSKFKEGQPLSPCQMFTMDKNPWPTLTGRQQFYIDHDWFLEFGEELPVHKDSPSAGGNYPLKLTGGHARWSIHSIWRDDIYMLRLQRGGPVMCMNPEDAKQRGIGDHEYVRVYNDVGDFRIHVKLSASVQRGQVIVYHAWEPYQFQAQQQFNSVMPTPIKPLQLVGNYGHLHFGFGHYEPNQVDRDTVVEVEKV